MKMVRLVWNGIERTRTELVERLDKCRDRDYTGSNQELRRNSMTKTDLEYKNYSLEN